MARRQPSGLGDLGRSRIRKNLNREDTAADRNLEDAIFGRGNAAPLPVAGQPLATPWQYPASSRVSAYQYDYGTADLRVVFVKYGTRWVYRNVNPAVFAAFDAAPSKGKFINATLNFTSNGRASSADDHYFTGV